MNRESSHFIGGSWSGSLSGRTYSDGDPYTGEVFATVAAGDADDARAAISSASSAFPAWAAAPPSLRQRVFLGAASALEGRGDEVRRMLAAETGCGSQFSAVQLEFCVNLLRQAAGTAYEPTGRILSSDIGGTNAYAIRRPVGVVGAIAPWNASLVLAGRAVVSALAAGNTVVLKPSEESPVTGGALWAQLLSEAGLPDGVLNVVSHAPGEAFAIADELITDPRVRRITFTGSTVTGRRVAEAAGRHLKPVLLQLSGHNPLIVLGDVDLDYAVRAAAYGAFVHQGQTCMCTRRIYVDRTVAAGFTERFASYAAGLRVGDPRDPATVIGPVINEWALSLLSRRVEEAVGLGARLLTGGSPEPPCFPPTVLTDVPPAAELAFEETFGPVVLIDVVDGPDDAVERANASRYGLTAGILTGDPYRGIELARRMQTGIVHVNDQTVNDEPQMPFGGVKDSGWGRYGTGFALDELTELQWVTARRDPRDYPF